jgi:hypothetical protein
MARKFSVPERALPNLAALIDNIDDLSSLRETVEGLAPHKRTPAEISGVFGRSKKISQTQARNIVNQILALQNLRQDLRLSADEVYDTVLESLESLDKPDWKDRIETWTSKKIDIIEVIDESHPLSIIQKSIRLSHSHQNVVHDTRIITDLRPVFDEPAQNIKQITMTFTLDVDYYDGTENRSIYFALDANDVTNLRKACERAETKILTTKRTMVSLESPLVVVGEENDA